MIDEYEKRIAGKFDERNSVAIRLADSQEWWFPRPYLEVRPVFRDGVAVTSYPVYTNTPKLDSLVELVGDCERIDEQVVLVATLAAELLKYHYDLADDELDQLLAYRLHDEQSQEWLKSVMEVATGRSGPKAGRAIGD